MAPDRVEVKVTFEVLTKYGVFRDAVLYPHADWPNVNLELDKTMRVINYEWAIENPPPPSPEPTKEQLMADREAKLAEVAVLDAQIAEKK